MKNILFVCVENSNRSQMAEAFAKIHGKGKINVYSSGSRPSGIINPKAIAAMKEVGYDLTTHDSKSLDQIPQIKYDYAITMGCGDECPFIVAKHRDDWKLDDPKHMNAVDFNKVRDEIERRVKELIEKF
ncbi:MAG: arsenate reductase ArsC [Bacteroidetes bacterium]|nr:arsenate reductase ArsC [Bacteroidota bacterium]